MRGAVIAAMVALATPALALDKPGAEPATRTCPQHGPGFVQIPGTTTCIRIGGRVRSEYDVVSGRSAARDAAGLRASGQVSMDARSDTAYGPVRTFVRVRAGQTNAFIQTR